MQSSHFVQILITRVRNIKIKAGHKSSQINYNTNHLKLKIIKNHILKADWSIKLKTMFTLLQLKSLSLLLLNKNTCHLLSGLILNYRKASRTQSVHTM